MRASIVIPLLVLAACPAPQDPGAEYRPPSGLSAALPDRPTVITRLAFGSCNRQNLPQPLWKDLLLARPQLWIWMGDNVYADTTVPGEMKKIYEQQLAHPGYSQVRAAIPVIGTWDDHDFGQNDAGRENPIKKEAQQQALDFLGEPAESPRRTQEGLYTSYMFGPKGKTLKIILLDTRYHRESPGQESDILGPAQWSWLEDQLRNSTADVHVLVSSIQLLHPVPSRKMERWINFPLARQRMLSLLKETRPANFFILSGDRHFSEMAFLPEGEGLPFLRGEITASGLSHTWENFPGEPNPLRVAGPITTKHFGLLDIDWENRSVIVEIRGENQSVGYKHLFSLHSTDRETRD
jgi:alkaline phosphatase D